MSEPYTIRIFVPDGDPGHPGGILPGAEPLAISHCA
jgi:hypothetical protein